jgi:tRNA1(Val) A37 N6-methylase TrmN6
MKKPFSNNYSNPRNHREKHLSSEELHQWFLHCSKLLAPQGTLWFIVPISNKVAIKGIIERLEMHIYREIQVQNQHGISVRVVFGITRGSIVKESSILKLRNTDGSYSKEYIDLTAEFHASPLQKQPKLHET